MAGGCDAAHAGRPRALAPRLGWWGAATLSAVFFALWHAYLRTGIFGAFFTLVMAVFHSLWPAIALHALVDLGAGMMAWLALREAQADAHVDHERGA